MRYFVTGATGFIGKRLVKALLELDSHLAVSVSHTTRAPRGQELLAARRTAHRQAICRTRGAAQPPRH